MNTVRQRGFALLIVLLVMTALAAVLSALVISLTTDLRQTAVRVNDSKAFWLAEAGIEKATWDLKTPSGSGGQGENWTTAGTGTMESFGDGTYNMMVVNWDFALSANDATVTATSSHNSDDPELAIDDNLSTQWSSDNVPSNGNPESITVQFPYQLTINKAKFVSPSTSSRARDYEWQVSTDGINFTTVFTGNDVAFNAAGVTNEFSAQANVTHLRLKVTKDGQGSPNRVSISTLEVGGKKITSTGTVNSLSKTLEQTIVADDSTQTAYDEIDWNEL